ncbi:hypothetical protein C0991_007890 [Blastosporella zonata]|nr:hypothetical protein C0991_007890 [Blastosporella zonata]
MLSPARRHLFSKLRLTSAQGCINLASLFSKSPELASNVRLLNVILGIYVFPDDPTVLDQAESFINILTSISPYVRTFNFENHTTRDYSFIRISKALQLALISFFQSPNLVEFTTRGLHDLPLASLAQCNQLQQLQIYQHRFSGHKESGYFGSPIAKHRWNLKYLAINCRLCAEFITKSYNLSTLCTLTTGTSLSFEIIRNLVHASQSTLEQLDCRVILDEEAAASTVSSVGIDTPRIRKCKVFATLGVQPDLTRFRALFLSLVGVTSPTRTVPHPLESLNFTLHMGNSHIFPNVASNDLWNTLDSTIMQRNYPSLVSVKIIITFSADSELFNAPLLITSIEGLLGKMPLLRASQVFELWINDKQVSNVTGGQIGFVN